MNYAVKLLLYVSQHGPSVCSLQLMLFLVIDERV